MTRWSQTGSLGPSPLAEAVVPNIAAPASASDAARPSVFLIFSFLDIFFLPRFAGNRATRSNDRSGLQLDGTASGYGFDGVLLRHDWIPLSPGERLPAPAPTAQHSKDRDSSRPRSSIGRTPLGTQNAVTANRPGNKNF